jgi:hypothetical protein
MRHRDLHEHQYHVKQILCGSNFKDVEYIELFSENPFTNSITCLMAKNFCIYIHIFNGQMCAGTRHSRPSPTHRY